MIRQRPIWEILDLALRVTRIYARRLIESVLITVIPCAILNAVVLHWVVADELTVSSITRYLSLMALLVYLEAPVATLPATQLMGRAMFMQETTLREIFRSLAAVARPLLWTQGWWRGGVLAFLLILSLRPSPEPSGVEVSLIVLSVYSSLLRATRPFVNEIIVWSRRPSTNHAARTSHDFGTPCELPTWCQHG